MIDTFLNYIQHEQGLSRLTVAAYANDLRQWARAATSNGRYELRPETTTVTDLRLWIAELSKAGVSARTIRRGLPYRP